MTRPRLRAAALLLACLLAACGGGDGGNSTPAAADCAADAQKAWLRGLMQTEYYWAGRSPDPEPDGYADAVAYFDALQFAGDATWPADRWSFVTPAQGFNLFYGEGRTLGYGLSVNGLEAVLPLRVRWVDAGSPAAAAGVRRGDEIVSIDGRSAATLLAGGDFGMLAPTAEGTTLRLVTLRAGVHRSVALRSAVHTLTPVPASRVLTLPGGGKAGYLMLRDFITQAEQPLADALASIRAQGAGMLILDLRYNGGGRISTAAVLASQIVGAVREGSVFTTLRYNAQRQSRNQSFVFEAGPAPAMSQVVVIAGRRTCSASELLVNGLAPFVNVRLVGEATCGKPYGFNPVESCANTWNAVNFESVNSRGVGGYVDGLAPTCAAADTFTGTPGAASESLTAAAIALLDSGVCAVSAERSPLAQRAGPRRRSGPEPGERQGMFAD